MKICRITYLTLISIILIIFSGCYLSKYEKASSLIPYFPDVSILKPGFNKVLYKTDLYIKGYELSGMMMIKENGNNSLKGAFFNEIGMSFMDFELIPTGKYDKLEMRIHYIYELLNRKQIIDNLEKDLNMLLARNPEKRQKAVLTEDEKHYRIFKLNSYKGYDCYYEDNMTGLVVKVVNIAKGTGRKRIEMVLSWGDGLEEISFVHENYDMEIILELISEFVN